MNDPAWPENVHRLIRMALEEDIGPGDVTAEAFVPADVAATAAVVARESGVLAGAGVAAAVFRELDPSLEVSLEKRDGDRLAAGDPVLRVRGRARSILSGERTALNFLQRLSGIATQAAAFVEAAKGTSVQILDTRKTAPGWRWLEKAAVAAGGARNHRHGLYDMVMVKDNHLLALSGMDSLREAVAELRASRPDIRIELEADTVGQVREFLTIPGVDMILLDNMSLDQLRECVALARGTGVKLEASGGVTLESVPAIAATGVDFISSGSLTHSVRALDLSLEFAAPRA